MSFRERRECGAAFIYKEASHVTDASKFNVTECYPSRFFSAPPTRGEAHARSWTIADHRRTWKIGAQFIVALLIAVHDVQRPNPHITTTRWRRTQQHTPEKMATITIAPRPPLESPTAGMGSGSSAVTPTSDQVRW